VGGRLFFIRLFAFFGAKLEIPHDIPVANSFVALFLLCFFFCLPFDEKCLNEINTTYSASISNDEKGNVSLRARGTFLFFSFCFACLFFSFVTTLLQCTLDSKQERFTSSLRLNLISRTFLDKLRLLDALADLDFIVQASLCRKGLV
jgi:hypothetical protein